jgi:predicted transcriptional regulator
LVISNANGKTAKEISEATGIKPMYVELALELLSGTGILEEKDGKYYIDEDSRALCGLVIKDMMRTADLGADLLH